MAVKGNVSLPAQRICSRCKFVSSQEVCKACVLLEGLNKGLPKLGIGKSSKAKKMLEEYNAKKAQENGILEKAVGDLNDSIENGDTLSKHTKPCRSGLCKSKNDKQNINRHIVNNETQCSNKKCCSGNCSNREGNPEESNSKINSLLEQYGLDDSPKDSPETQNDTSTNGNRYDDVVNSDDEENGLYSNQDEENSCSGTCGKMGSLQIGF